MKISHKKCPWSLYPTSKNSQTSVREAKIYTREKTEKTLKLAVIKLKVGARKVKKAEKNRRKKEILRMRISEKRPKKAFTPTFEFHAQKKHWVD